MWSTNLELLHKSNPKLSKVPIFQTRCESKFICIATFQNLVAYIFHAKICICCKQAFNLSLCHRSVQSSVCLCFSIESVSKSHREERKAKWRMPSSSSKVNQSANPPVDASRLNKVCKCVCVSTGTVELSWPTPLGWTGMMGVWTDARCDGTAPCRATGVSDPQYGAKAQEPKQGTR